MENTATLITASQVGNEMAELKATITRLEETCDATRNRFGKVLRVMVGMVDKQAKPFEPLVSHAEEIREARSRIERITDDFCSILEACEL
jgi:hypothetical protein